MTTSLHCYSSSCLLNADDGCSTSTAKSDARRPNSSEVFRRALWPLCSEIEGKAGLRIRRKISGSPEERADPRIFREMGSVSATNPGKPSSLLGIIPHSFTFIHPYIHTYLASRSLEREGLSIHFKASIQKAFIEQAQPLASSASPPATHAFSQTVQPAASAPVPSMSQSPAPFAQGALGEGGSGSARLATARVRVWDPSRGTNMG